MKCIVVLTCLSFKGLSIIIIYACDNYFKSRRLKMMMNIITFYCECSVMYNYCDKNDDK